MKKGVKLILTPILVVGIGVGAYYGYRWYRETQILTVNARQTGENAQQWQEGTGGPMARLTETVERSLLRSVVTASGTVKLKDEQSVYATGNARVKEVRVEVGDAVTEGQTLITYDAESTKSALEKSIKEAQLSLENQRLNLAAMQLPAEKSELDQLNNSVESAEKQVYDANASLASTDASIERQKSDAEKQLYDANAALTSTDAKIAQQHLDIEKAREAIEKAELEAEKSKALYEAGGITQSDYDTALNAKESAEEQERTLTTALEDLNRTRESNLKNIEAIEKTLAATLTDLNRTRESNLKNIETAEKAVEYAVSRYEDALQVMSTEAEQIQYRQQQNQVALSELNLEDLNRQLNELVYETQSPLSGTVTQVNVEKGSTVNVDAALLQVADFTQLVVDANISEYDAPSVSLGQSVSMTSDGIPGVVYTGTITKISNTATTQSAISGTETVVPIQISVDNVDGNIKPGFGLDLEILVADKPDALNISLSAVKTNRADGTRYVFKVEEGILKLVPVTLGVQTDMEVEILSGLSEGDQVIASPTDDMADETPLTAYIDFSGEGTAPQQGGFSIGGMFGGARNIEQAGAVPVGPGDGGGRP
jgi:HlyD family secretion protein